MRYIILAALIAMPSQALLGQSPGQNINLDIGGRAVIGGVITSTLLTLVVIPTFYEILDDWREWILTKLGARKHADAEHAKPIGPTPVTTDGRLEKLA